MQKQNYTYELPRNIFSVNTVWTLTTLTHSPYTHSHSPNTHTLIKHSHTHHTHTHQTHTLTYSLTCTCMYICTQELVGLVLQHCCPGYTVSHDTRWSGEGGGREEEREVVRFLDIGCGSGAISLALLQECPQVILHADEIYMRLRKNTVGLRDII